MSAGSFAVHDAFKGTININELRSSFVPAIQLRAQDGGRVIHAPFQRNSGDSMSKQFSPLALSEASPKVRQMLNEIDRRFSSLPNFFSTIAHSEAALFATSAFHGALSDGNLTALEREAIILAISAQNKCQYCVSAHATFARQLGAERDEIIQYSRGRSTDARTDSILRIASAVARIDRETLPTEMDTGRAAGLTEAEIVEIVCWASFSQYLNHVAEALGIIIDYPRPEEFSLEIDDAA